MKATSIIRSPIITEKATALAEKMTYMFYVDSRATKIDVKHAIKELYGQDVATVRSMISPVKTKLLKRSIVNKRPEMKKVMVILKGKKKLDVTKITKEAKK
jgi:large subunit ribosomal protein L23